MNIFKKIREFVAQLSPVQVYQYIGGILAIFLVVITIILYIFYSQLNNYERKIKRLNQLRKESRTILEQHERVKQQQNDVNTILAQDPTFKIKEYFLKLVAEVGLSQQNTKQEVSDPQDLENGYSEIKLDASFVDITMQQLTDLLYKIEQNERIYTKELAITKSLKGPIINVTLIIATLQPKVST
ncbi:MAG: hypothetical protein WC707_05190 [Candidatus Babeliaceae bacterium]|jgi:hypothetical protein